MLLKYVVCCPLATASSSMQCLFWAPVVLQCWMQHAPGHTSRTATMLPACSKPDRLCTNQQLTSDATCICIGCTTSLHFTAAEILQHVKSLSSSQHDPSGTDKQSTVSTLRHCCYLWHLPLDASGIFSISAFVEHLSSLRLWHAPP